jgi:hypothetical protein
LKNQAHLKLKASSGIKKVKERNAETQVSLQQPKFHEYAEALARVKDLKPVVDTITLGGKIDPKVLEDAWELAKLIDEVLASPSLLDFNRFLHRILESKELDPDTRARYDEAMDRLYQQPLGWANGVYMEILFKERQKQASAETWRMSSFSARD